MVFGIGPRSYDYCLSREDLKDIRKAQKSEKIIKRLGDRCAIIEADGLPTLLSYWTQVCAVKDGRLIRYWDDWSATTAKHIRLFCREYNLAVPNKKEWLAMPIGEEN